MAVRGLHQDSWAMQDAADAASLNAYGITFAILGDGPYEEIAAFRVTGVGVQTG